MKKVGILGASGKIGLLLAKALHNSCMIIGGSRNYNNSFDEIQNFKWQQVDLYNEDSLYKFCKDCDLVINCAGPAGLVKERVAIVSGNLNIPYIDLSDVLLVDDSINKDLIPEGVYIGGAGYVPGLGGLLIKWISNNLFDKLDRVKCFQGGRQRFSKIAFMDIVLSSFNGKGKGDSYYRNGRILKEHTLGTIKRRISVLQEEFLMKSYLSDEMIDAAEKFNVGQLHWFNNVSDEKLKDLVMQSVQLLVTNEKDKALDEIKKKADEYDRQSNKDEKEWSVIVMECRGIKDGLRKEYEISYRVDKEEEACAMIAFLVAKNLLANKLENGMYWPHDIISNDEIEEMIQKNMYGHFTIEEKKNKEEILV